MIDGEITYMSIDDVEIRLEVKGSVATVWAYSENTWALQPNPAWVEISQFDVRDYVPRER